MNKKLLIGSPICQHPAILQAFLQSLKRLTLPGVEVHYHFIDDNHEPLSKVHLETFASEVPHVRIDTPNAMHDTSLYIAHNWNQNKISKVAAYKDGMIEHARTEGFDYLFLIDSDILLEPCTVQHLMDTSKEIIAEIFWTRWAETSMEQPQVWLKDFYTQYESFHGERLEKDEMTRRMHAFYTMLREPGVYKVGGLGACTLIARSALEKDISFRTVDNLSFWGEDRHFCVRARVLDIELYVDTHHPAFHVYRFAEMERGMVFMQRTE